VVKTALFLLVILVGGLATFWWLDESSRVPTTGGVYSEGLLARRS